MNGFLQVPQLTWAIIAAEVEFRLLGPRLGDWLALGIGYAIIAISVINAGCTALAWQVSLLLCLHAVLS